MFFTYQDKQRLRRIEENTLKILHNQAQDSAELQKLVEPAEALNKQTQELEASIKNQNHEPNHR